MIGDGTLDPYIISMFKSYVQAIKGVTISLFMMQICFNRCPSFKVLFELMFNYGINPGLEWNVPSTSHMNILSFVWFQIISNVTKLTIETSFGADGSSGKMYAFNVIQLYKAKMHGFHQQNGRSFANECGKSWISKLWNIYWIDTKEAYQEKEIMMRFALRHYIQLHIRTIVSYIYNVLLSARVKCFSHQNTDTKSISFLSSNPSCLCLFPLIFILNLCIL